MTTSSDSFKTHSLLRYRDRDVGYYALPKLAAAGFPAVQTLPYSIRVLLENLLRHEDGVAVRRDDILAVIGWDPASKSSAEVNFRPSRVLLQDFTGVPALVDLAAMREAFVRMGGDAKRINPIQPADLVIDHSVQVDAFGSRQAFQLNIDREFSRNQERYQFLKWGQSAFENMRVVPPGTGIVHQVNLEFLATVVCTHQSQGNWLAYPDSLVGTDSHTTMINGLGVVGWGVGGIEAEAAMLGQPIGMLLPEVVGFKLRGRLREGATATDLVLTVTEILRRQGVVDKFVEFFGEGLAAMALTDRATVANMAPEYGATVGFFPVDAETLAYLRFSGRDEAEVRFVEDYYRSQGLFYTPDAAEPRFSEVIELDLSHVVPSLAGPRRPQDRLPLSEAKGSWRRELKAMESRAESRQPVAVDSSQGRFDLQDGAVVIAAITSCTNTSNPSVMLGAGLLARNAVRRGLKVKPWVKTSLAPGSQVVTEYLREAELLEPLEALRFFVVGYGCTTCIGNSGPLDPAIVSAVEANDLVVAAVLSGNRNFEGRVNPSTRANYLASPPLVVAYALAGTMDIDFANEPIGTGDDGKPVFLREIWPSESDITETLRTSVHKQQFVERYSDVLQGPAAWRAIRCPEGEVFQWDPNSTYIRKAPFFDAVSIDAPSPPQDIEKARVLLWLGDSVTTDHISPAGSIDEDGPAARYLREHGVGVSDFNSYGSRRGNHEVMVRGTFANIRLRNRLSPGTEGGITRHLPDGETLSVYDAAMRYAAEKVPLLIIAGKEYGTGSSRDWAAKGPALLGIRAVIAESFERIHRSNLVGMGILPLQFRDGESSNTLGLTGTESFRITGVTAGLKPGQLLSVEADGRRFQVIARLNTPQEVDYLRHGGILPYVLRQLAASANRKA